MNKAIFAFSADPIHYGHIDTIERASKQFDKLIVAIGVNPHKKCLFSLKERLDMVKKTISYLKNIEIISFKGLLVDYAFEHDISTIVKCVRNKEDLKYEKELAKAGETQKLGIKTKLINAKYPHISSTIVKALLKEQGFIHELVPLYVKQKLEAKNGQYIIGITGEIGVGKTYVMNKLKRKKVHTIELDHIGHYILGNSKEEKYKKVRKEIARTFGLKLIKGTIDRKALGEIVFNDFKKLKKLNKIIEKSLQVRLRRELYKKKGLILFNAALIAETDMMYLCNNNIILVTCDKKVQEQRLRKRGLSQKQIKTRLKSQLNTKEKKDSIEKAISKDNYGKLWVLDNSKEKSLDKLYKDIMIQVK